MVARKVQQPRGKWCGSCRVMWEREARTATDSELHSEGLLAARWLTHSQPVHLRLLLGPTAICGATQGRGQADLCEDDLSQSRGA